jgi:hypothetical protein
MGPRLFRRGNRYRTVSIARVSICFNGANALTDVETVGAPIMTAQTTIASMGPSLFRLETPVSDSAKCEKVQRINGATPFQT